MRDIIAEARSKRDSSVQPQRDIIAEARSKKISKLPSENISDFSIPRISAIGAREIVRRFNPAKEELSGIETYAPMVGQAVGSALGGATAIPTIGYVGSVLGSGVGDVLGKTAQAARTLSYPDYSGVKKNLGVTALTEGIMRGGPNFYFRKQIGGKAREAAGRKVGEIADKVSQSQIGKFARVGKNRFVQAIDDALESNKFERGPIRSGLIRIRNKLSDIKRPLTFDETRQLEQQLGREAQFATEATQGRLKVAPSAPKLNIETKKVRSLASNKVDEIAAQAGYPEFEKVSSGYAKLSQKYPEKELQKRGFSGLGWLERFGALTGAGALYHHQSPFGIPLLMGSTLAMLPPAVRTSIFRKAIDTTTGRTLSGAARLASSEAARKLTD